MPRRRKRRDEGLDPASAVAIFILGGLVWLYNQFQSASSQSQILIVFLCVIFGVAGVVGLLALKSLSDRKKAEREAALNTAWLKAMGQLFPQRAVDLLPRTPRELEPFKLEHLAQQVYARLGYQAEHRGGAGDGGIDVKLTDASGQVFIVQCKQYKASLQPSKVREVRGTLRGRERGIIWAPGGFTSAAKQDAQRSSIELLDASDILDLVRDAYPVIEALPATSPQAPMRSTIANNGAAGLPLGLNKTQWAIVAALSGVVGVLALVLVALLTRS